MWTTTLAKQIPHPQAGFQALSTDAGQDQLLQNQGRVRRAFLRRELRQVMRC